MAVNNFTSMPGVKGFTTPSSFASQNISLFSANVSSLLTSRGTVSTGATTPTSVSSHLSTQVSQVANALNIDSASTTTHRAPRPKPVLTNSEKLKDKNWENDKFRKPPPEDLVPLSTTMRPMIHANSTIATVVTAHLAPNSTQPSFLIKNDSKSDPTAVRSSSLLANLSKIIDNVNSNSSSAPLVTSTPLLSSTTALPVSSTPRAVAPNATSANLNISSHSNPSIPSVQSSPATPVISKIKEVTSAKPTFTSQVASNKSPEDNVTENVKKSAQYLTKPGSVNLPTMKYSTSLEEVPQNHTSEELALPILEEPEADNVSHAEKDENWHSDLSLDEQDTPSLNLSRITSTVTEGSAIGSQSHTLKHFSSVSSVKVSTPHPQHHPLDEEPEKSGIVRTKSFVELPVKATVAAKSVEKPSVPPAEQEYDKSSTSSQKQSAHVVTSGDKSTVSLLEPLPTKNAAQVFESLSHVSPKHTHHSKPASTVVNDTEVTHTVIDAFANRLEKYGLSKMQLMYLTVGMVLLATSFLFLGFLCFNPRDPKSKTDEEEMNGPIVRSGTRNRINSGQTVTPPSRWLRHALIILMLLILMITSGVQAMYGQLLLVYAMQSPLQLSRVCVAQRSSD